MMVVVMNNRSSSTREAKIKKLNLELSRKLNCETDKLSLIIISLALSYLASKTFCRMDPVTSITIIT